MKILIIGGSRFVGPHLVKLLIARKHTITVFNRGVISTKYPKGVTFIKGDRDKGFCAFIGSQTSRAIEELKFDYFLNFGTSASYQKTEIFPLAEESPIGDWPAFGDYNKGKVACERVLEKSGIKCGTIRPAYILGPKNYCDRENFIYSRIIKKIPLILPGNGLGVTQFVFVDEVALAIVALVEHRAQGAFNIAGDQIITNTGLVGEMGKIVGKEPIIQLNPDAIGLNFKEEEFPFDNENLIVSNDKIKKYGIEFIPLIDGLRRDYKNFYQKKQSKLPGPL
ncbi:MAG: mRNA-binding protein [Candidatus Gottesmanbacteria bacterium GW2011_GWB1_44_11c]|uniref:mRNA-binding protein n=2 Tax=Candidatus Gottesmaniibacteriota TaxID=1752720 RepID=A0A0G1GS09_9BACT|nr:MAG: mRNA-binding protein [Candidatus Gottesmanbacteria bacterium GW2011_GWB1_44_11c]